MENKKQLLERLKKRNEELKPIVFKSFKTEKELLNHRKKITKKRDEYYDNQEQIQQLEWELMTPEEQEEQRKLEHFLKLKAKGDPFDPDEII